MRLVVSADADAFARAAREFLESRVEWNVLVTVLADVIDGRYQGESPVFAYATDERGAVIGAALRTPPWVMLAAGFADGSADQLIASWLELDPAVNGVSGHPASAAAIARAWSERTGGAASTRLRMAVHELQQVRDPPRPAPGELRPAQRAERELLLAWVEEFFAEAGVAGGAAQTLVDARAAHGGLRLWDHDGPVSLVCVNRAVAEVVRIGPVYTPPPLRRKGYAGSAVAAASRAALADGARSCVLSTDLANPTSNKIYAEVGYRRVSDWEELSFESAMPSFAHRAERKAAPTGRIQWSKSRRSTSGWTAAQAA